ncbi:MAG: MiaB/RimO family radical SAM methylthiotransferase [Phycisphaerae bacterium]
MPGKYLITTLGCKVNQYETQQIRELLESLGFEPATGKELPDVAVVNTCAVTATASRKSRQALRKLGRSDIRLVAAVGCAVGEDAERLRRCMGVDLVIDHNADIRETLRAAIIKDSKLAPATAETGDTNAFGMEPHRASACPTPTTNQPFATKRQGATGRNEVWMNPGSSGTTSAVARADTSSGTRILPTPLPIVKRDDDSIGRIESFTSRKRAFLKIQDGCDAYCTYCIIPRLRPTLRSKPIDAVVTEARKLVQHGHKEIILTGIFLGAYGRETALRKRFDRRVSPLARLIEALSAVAGLERLRLSSLEPGDVDQALLTAMATNGACVPHLHLPLQSGSEAILRRMNRQYTRQEFLVMIDRVRTTLDRPAISTDVIAGFPGETERDFQQTLDVVRAAQCVKVHAFPFSPRDKTAAARWQQDFVAPEVIKDRLATLTALERETSLAFRRSLLGATERVIIEKHMPPSIFDVTSTTLYRGRCDRYFEIHFEADETGPGEMVTVRIDRVSPTRTHGTAVIPTPATHPLTVLQG